MVACCRPEKNRDVLCAGLLWAACSFPSLRVLAGGAGPLLARFRAWTAQTELGARTVFAGDVAEVLPCLWAMDVGCLTSGSNEGFSNAIVEQMAVGLPMIVIVVCGTAEGVVDDENGRVL